MSAWDIAGAVVWTAAFGIFGGLILWAFITPEKLPDSAYGGLWVAMAIALGSLAGAVFCISRLLGAHA